MLNYGLSPAQWDPFAELRQLPIQPALGEMEGLLDVDDAARDCHVVHRANHANGHQRHQPRKDHDRGGQDKA